MKRETFPAIILYRMEGGEYVFSLNNQYYWLDNEEPVPCSEPAYPSWVEQGVITNSAVHTADEVFIHRNSGIASLLYKAVMSIYW